MTTDHTDTLPSFPRAAASADISAPNPPHAREAVSPCAVASRAAVTPPEDSTGDENRNRVRRPLALVTGASRGIGLAIAGALAAEGYDLILTCSRTLPALEEAAAQIARSHGVFCRTFLCDGGDPEAVEALFAVLGTIPLTLLVNNAGISHIGLLQEMTVPEWNRVISTNLSSCFYFCRAAIPLFLRRTTGSIINISSVWGSAGASMEVAYSASKGGVNAFTKALAKELAPSGIPVNALACGVVDTEMNQCFSEEEREALRGEIPADRFASPDEIARAVVHLAQMPSYLTGQVITIDGGWI